MRELNRDLYGRQFSPARDLGVAWLLAHERHKSGEPHAHAIVYAMEPLDLLARRTDTKAVLNDRLGFARVEAVRSPDRAHAYACKYVVKGGELEFSDNFHNFVRYYREAA
jgi:hypothetical protein